MSAVVTRLDTPIVSLKVEGELNWSGVGEAFAHADGGEQAEFLVGLAAAFDRLGPLATGMQFAFIADAMKSGDVVVMDKVQQQIDMLARHLEREL